MISYRGTNPSVIPYAGAQQRKRLVPPAKPARRKVLEAEKTVAGTVS
jgi:hypothetical protein